jgi:hypothetical protein
MFRFFARGCAGTDDFMWVDREGRKHDVKRHRDCELMAIRHDQIRRDLSRNPLRLQLVKGILGL